MNCKSEKLETKIYVFVLLGLFYCMLSLISAVFSNPPSIYQYLFIIICFSLMMWFLLTCFFKFDGITSLLFLFTVGALVPTLNLNFNRSLVSQVGRLANMYIWVGTFYIAREFGNEKFLSLFLGMSIIHLLIGIPVLIEHYRHPISLITHVYFSLFLVPFALSCKRTRNKYIFLAICLTPVLLSEKRTGIMAFLVAFLVYILLEVRLLKKERRGGVLKYFLFFAIILLFLLFLIRVFGLGILERFENIEEDQGSGRIDVWKTTWGMIKSSSLIQIIFGHGYSAVAINSPLELSAHNDFLEVIYDFGIIGCISYFGFLILLIKKGVKYYKKRAKNASVFLMSIVLALVFSLSSHLIIFPTYFIYLCIFWGTYIGTQERIEKCKE